MNELKERILRDGKALGGGILKVDGFINHQVDPMLLAPSHTKGRMVELIVSPEHLRAGERVLIIDDFLASGATILGLVRLAQTAGTEIVGVGALIEKTFEGGRKALESLGVPVEALAPIASLDDGKIVFAE